jgi:hypothetical protein
MFSETLILQSYEAKADVELIPTLSGDYTSGTALYKYQWDAIHNPEIIWFSWLQEEEEGEMSGFDYAGVRNIVESLRFGYAFNTSVTIDCNDKMGLIVNNITLGDGNKYDEVIVGFHNDLPFEINPRECGIADGFSVLNNTNSLRTGFCLTSGKGSRNFFKVEIGTKVINNQFENLKNYLTCENEIEWRKQIDDILNKGGYSLANLNSMPDKALKELENEQRIKLLQKICKSELKDYYNLASRVIINIKKEEVKDFFERLNNTSIIYDLKNQMNFNYYSDFIINLTMLFSQQDDIKERLKNISYDRIFVYQEREGTFGASIDNYFNHYKDKIEVTGKVVVIKPIENAFGVPIAGSPENFNAYNYELKYCDLVGLELRSDYGHFKAQSGKLIPLPAFYFSYLQEKKLRESNIRTAELTIDILSLAIGIHELKLAVKGGQYFYSAYLAVGVTLNTYNLLRLNSEIDKYFDQLEKSNDKFKNLFEFFDKFSIIYDISNIVVSRVVTKNNIQFFNDFIAVWTLSKDEIYKHILNHPEGGEEKAIEITEEFQKFVNDIVVEIKKNK